MDQISCFVPVPSENGANALRGLSSNSIVTTPCHRQHQVQSGLREGQNFGVRTSDDLVLSVSSELAFNIDIGLQPPGEWRLEMDQISCFVPVPSENGKRPSRTDLEQQCYDHVSPSAPSPIRAAPRPEFWCQDLRRFGALGFSQARIQP